MNNYTWNYIQSHPQETKRLLGINYDVGLSKTSSEFSIISINV
jgi:hypothetical protein